ncbi:MAG: transcriptional repressor NrdR [Duodenibacillus sp.]|jgi:transcriptional repressor NrdR|nr:transcriptional repressor NrdR [Duodenibacillus sp.]
MRCPFCKEKDSAVIDSRASDDGYSIRRRRQCSACGKRFTTFERVELNMPLIVKRTGARREYDREKIRGSMRLALRKRPVNNERVEEAIGAIEQRLRTLGEREVMSSRVGEFVLEELKKLDSVAYIRFASVYFNVDNPEGFFQLLRELETES